MLRQKQKQKQKKLKIKVKAKYAKVTGGLKVEFLVWQVSMFGMDLQCI